MFHHFEIELMSRTFFLISYETQKAMTGDPSDSHKLIHFNVITTSRSWYAITSNDIVFPQDNTKKLTSYIPTTKQLRELDHIKCHFSFDSFHLRRSHFPSSIEEIKLLSDSFTVVLT